MNINNLIEKLPQKEQKYFNYLIKNLEDTEKEKFIKEIYELSDVEQDIILNLLLRLSPAQLKNVIHNSNENGPLIIIGDEISSKRTIIANRVAYHIIARGTKVEEILGLTFSNMNAGNILDIISNSLPEKMIIKMDIDTINSIALKILNENVLGTLNIEKVGYKLSPKFRVLIAREQMLLLKRSLEESKIPSSELGFSTLLRSIISLKRKLISCDNAEKNAKTDVEKKIAIVYKIYHDKLLKNNTCDINDLIRLCLELFKRSPEVLDYYRNKYKMIIVDDYHYSSFAHYNFIKTITGDKKNLTFTAAHKINVYGWASDEDNYTNQIEKDYPGSKIVVDEREPIDVEDILKREIFLSTGEEIDEIEPAEAADFNDYINGDALIRLEEEGDVNQISFVVNSIIRKNQEGVKFGDIAVVVRKNKHLALIKKVFKGSNIPFFVEGDKLLTRDEIDSVLALLKTVYYLNLKLKNQKLEKNEMLALNEALKVIFLEITPLQLEFNTFVQMEKVALEENTDIFGVLSQESEEKERFKTRYPLKDREIIGFFKDLMINVSGELEEFDAPALIELMTNETKFLDSLVNEGEMIGRLKAENIKYLYLYSSEFVKKNRFKGSQGLKSFLEDIEAKKKKQMEEYKLHQDEVRVITLNGIEDISYNIYYLV